MSKNMGVGETLPASVAAARKCFCLHRFPKGSRLWHGGDILFFWEESVFVILSAVKHVDNLNRHLRYAVEDHIVPVGPASKTASGIIGDNSIRIRGRADFAACLTKFYCERSCAFWIIASNEPGDHGDIGKCRISDDDFHRRLTFQARRGSCRTLLRAT